MAARLKCLATHRLLWLSLGTLWLGGCITDLQLRDFLESTAVRTFWQAIGTLFQAAVVGTQG